MEFKADLSYIRLCLTGRQADLYKFETSLGSYTENACLRGKTTTNKR